MNILQIIKQKGGIKILYRDNSVYEGKIKEDKKHGLGKMVWTNSVKHSIKEFEGEWDNDNIKAGTMKWITTEYIGKDQYKLDKMFTGTFKNNEPGDGTLILNNGTKYIGNLIDMKLNGPGTYINKQGDKFKGDLINNMFKDEVTVIVNKTGRKYTYPIIKTNYMGNTYNGCWSNNRPEGYGLLINSEPSIFGEIYYIGEFQDGKKSGEGTMTYLNNIKYEGIWKDNEIIGYGKYILPNGNEYTGCFSDMSSEDQIGQVKPGWQIGIDLPDEIFKNGLIITITFIPFNRTFSIYKNDNFVKVLNLPEILIPISIDAILEEYDFPIMIESPSMISPTEFSILSFNTQFQLCINFDDFFTEKFHNDADIICTQEDRTINNLIDYKKVEICGNVKKKDGCGLYCKKQLVKLIDEIKCLETQGNRDKYGFGTNDNRNAIIFNYNKIKIGNLHLEDSYDAQSQIVNPYTFYEMVNYKESLLDLVINETRLI